MANGPKKRTRLDRVAALELPPSRWALAWAALKRRDVLLRVALALGAAVVLCVIIRAWQPPFVYRSGYSLSRDLTARVAFQVVDPMKTDEERERARRQVRYIYTQDPELLLSLPSSLRNAVAEVMAAATYAELNPQAWDDFQPQAEGEEQPSDEERHTRFEKFREPLLADETLANRFEEAATRALAPFVAHGLLKKFPQKPGEGNQDEISVYLKDDPEAKPEPEIVKIEDVLIGNGTVLRDSLREQLGSNDVADPAFDWLWRHVEDSLSLDDARTKKAEDAAVASVVSVIVPYEVGQKLALAGQTLSAEQIELLRFEHEATVDQFPLHHKLSRALTVLALVSALFTLCGLYLGQHEQRLLNSTKQLAMVLLLVILAVGLSCWAATADWRPEIIPLLLLGQTLAIAYRRELALLFVGVVGLVIVLGLGTGLGGFLLLTGVVATAVLQLARVRSRSKLIYVACWAGLAAFLLTIGTAVLDDQPVDKTLLAAARNFLWTLSAGFLMTGLLPFVEWLFDVLTDISLLELGDVSHPLLQELVRRAPSTYNHSITVGSIAEAAANSIGARGLLVRVGASYHDIGKMLKPIYFIENQPPEENRHEGLVPAMSTLVIIAHVKDGADLARQHKMPQQMIDFIEQHHGTTLVEYFYGRASEQSEADPDGPKVDESAFRYPGPKPQTKEAGVLMLADAAESACRSLFDPAPARIESMVHDVNETKLKDGQFDESGLTLKELRTVENSVIKSLIANYHSRVKYPDQRTA